MPTIGKNIKKVRQEKGVSQNKLPKLENICLIPSLKMSLTKAPTIPLKRFSSSLGLSAFRLMI
jgi:hypothetical protein